jgi:hypothetical protein
MSECQEPFWESTRKGGYWASGLLAALAVPMFTVLMLNRPAEEEPSQSAVAAAEVSATPTAGVKAYGGPNPAIAVPVYGVQTAYYAPVVPYAAPYAVPLHAAPVVQSSPLSPARRIIVANGKRPLAYKPSSNIK